MSNPSQYEDRPTSFGLPPDDVLFGKSAVMRDIRLKLERICSTTVPILLQGEVGVGKGVLSRYIHVHSPWVDGPYVRVNCATMSGPTACLDLFAAAEPRVSARGSPGCGMRGTIYLNEVGDLRQELQRQLSHVLADIAGYQDGEPRQRRDSNRIICGSTRDLRREMKLGHFLRELFDRLVVVTLNIPPLRNRIEDLPEISEYLRRRYTAQLGVADTPFPSELLARARTHPWAGNVRELESFVCRYVLVGPDRFTREAEGGASGEGWEFGMDGSDGRSAGRMQNRWKHKTRNHDVQN